MKIAVIGGGWAGLSTAVELSAAGQQVVLFESARQLGGRARRIESDGRVLDNGQHILIGAYHETLALMRTVGVSPERALHRQPLELRNPGAGFALRLPPWPAPLHLAGGLLAARGCSLGEKLSAARFMRALQAADYRLNRDCTLGSLLERHRQTGRLRRYLWEPLCLAALNTAVDHASAQIFANVLRDSLGGRGTDTDLLLPTADLGALLPDAAAAFSEARGGAIRLSTRIDEIPADYRLHGETFDRVVLATAPQHAAALLAKMPATRALAATLESYDYEPIGTLYAAYPPELRLPCPMLGLDDGGDGRIGQWVFDRGRLLETPGVLAFVLSAHGPWELLDADALMGALHHELESALGTTLAPPHWHRLICERRATFSCRPNLPRPPARTPIPGLWLAGDYVCADYPATLEGAVRSGRAVATDMLRSGGSSAD